MKSNNLATEVQSVFLERVPFFVGYVDAKMAFSTVFTPFHGKPQKSLNHGKAHSQLPTKVIESWQTIQPITDKSH